MIQDCFRDGGDSSVTVAVAGGFVGILSMANMAGRFVWSSTSDVVGRGGGRTVDREPVPGRPGQPGS
jgi:hypothetical protein